MHHKSSRDLYKQAIFFEILLFYSIDFGPFIFCILIFFVLVNLEICIFLTPFTYLNFLFLAKSKNDWLS